VDSGATYIVVVEVVEGGVTAVGLIHSNNVLHLGGDGWLGKAL